MDDDYIDQTALVTVSSAIDHYDTLGDGMWQLYKDGRMVDITINCHEQSMRAHKVVLAVFSSILRTSLETSTDSLPYGPEALNLDEVAESGNDVEYILEFIYRGHVTLPRHRLQTVLRTAEMLEIQSLVEAICAVHEEDEEDEEEEPGTSGQMTKTQVEFPMNGGGTQVHVSGEVSPADHLSIDLHTDEYFETMQMCENGNQLIDSEEFEEEEEEDEEEDEEAEEDVDITVQMKQQHVSRRQAKDKESGRRHKPQLRVLRNNNNASVVEAKEHHFRCKHCDKVFSTSRGLETHVRDHVSDLQGRHRCLVCDFWTMQSWTLLKHMAVVHRLDADGNRLSELIACDRCDFTCVSQEQLQQHAQRRHATTTDTSLLKCPQCDFRAASASELERHAFGSHRKQRHNDKQQLQQFECAVCGFCVTSYSKLVRHEMSHLGIKPYKCDVCGLEYADRGKFKNHVLRHYNNEKLFMCSTCDYTCHRKDNLLRHEREVHRGKNTKKQKKSKNRQSSRTAAASSWSKYDRPFVCHVCGRTIRRRDNFRIHLKNMHNINLEDVEKNGVIHRTELIACTVCNHTCTSNEHLAKHIREVHGGGSKHPKNSSTGAANPNRPFACHVCDYSCHRKDNLRVHIWRVHGVHQDRKRKATAKKKVKENVAFECRVCGNSIRRKDNFRVHLRTLHGISLEEMEAMDECGILPGHPIKSTPSKVRNSVETGSTAAAKASRFVGTSPVLSATCNGGM